MTKTAPRITENITNNTPLNPPQGVETSFSQCDEGREGEPAASTTPHGADGTLEAFHPAPDFVHTLAKRYDIHPLAVLYAVPTFKRAEASRGGRVRSYGVRFERWLKDLAKDMQAKWWSLPARDWTVADWRYRAFGDTPASEVKRGSTWPVGKVMPHHMHKVREGWDTDTMGPPPWHEDTNVPTVLLEAYAPWWDDKQEARKAHMARLAAERDAEQGKPVRIAREWRPSQDEVQQIAAAHDLLGFEVSAQAADFASYMSSEAARRKNIRVKSPYESFSRWVAKRVPEIKAARGGKPSAAARGGKPFSKAKGSDPVTGQEWRDFLGAIDDEGNARVKERMWATLLKDAAPAKQASPWKAYNGEIPPDVYAEYGATWGWASVPTGAHTDVGRD